MHLPLLQASEAFRAKSARADELLRGLGGELSAAVGACIDAAEHELQPTVQQELPPPPHPPKGHTYARMRPPLTSGSESKAKL